MPKEYGYHGGEMKAMMSKHPKNMMRMKAIASMKRKRKK